VGKRVGEAIVGRWVPDRRWRDARDDRWGGCGSSRGPAQAEQARAGEGLDGDGVALIAAEQDQAGGRAADQEADVAERGIGAAAGRR
jgi:hypothetical protein